MMQFIDNGHPAAPASIIDILRKNIGGVVAQRSHETVHASDVTKEGFCPRQFAFNDLFKVKPQDEVLSTELAVTFDVGRETARLFCEKWAGNDIVGRWRCRRCSAEAEFSRKPPREGCPNPGGLHDLEYLEIGAQHSASHVTGSFDALMDCGGDKLILTELKIMGMKEFDTIVAPLAEHRIRTSLYLRLLAGSENPYKQYINLDYGKVFYVTRGHGKKHPLYNTILPFKEYTIGRDDETSDAFLLKGEKVKNFREFGIVPEGICAHAGTACAIACKHKVACFSGQYPAGSTVEYSSQ